MILQGKEVLERRHPCLQNAYKAGWEARTPTFYILHPVIEFQPQSGGIR
jgi:hypothetical protein